MTMPFEEDPAMSSTRVFGAASRISTGVAGWLFCTYMSTDHKKKDTRELYTNRIDVNIFCARLHFLTTTRRPSLKTT